MNDFESIKKMLENASIRKKIVEDTEYNETEIRLSGAENLEIVFRFWHGRLLMVVNETKDD